MLGPWLEDRLRTKSSWLLGERFGRHCCCKCRSRCIEPLRCMWGRAFCNVTVSVCKVKTSETLHISSSTSATVAWSFLLLNPALLIETMLFTCKQKKKLHKTHHLHHHIWKGSVIFASWVVDGEWICRRACFSRINFICLLYLQHLICAYLNQTTVILYLKQCLLPNFL